MHTSLPLSPRRGSAILVTVLITVCLSIVIFSILELGLFERRMNANDRLMAQARYAAESVVENACAQIVKELKLNSWLASDYFNTSASKFTYAAPPAATYAGTNVVTSSVELKVPDMTTVQILTVPPESPDSLRGQSIEIRRLTLYSKATARDDSGREATAYCTETLQIRGQSPATNMAFYNMELELAPGPNMTATGPFFSNKNIYFAVSNGKTLNIQGTVTTPGDLLWGRIVEDESQAWTASSAEQKGTVKLSSGYTPVVGNPDAEGTYAMADFYNNGTYSDSLMSSTGTWDDTKWKNYESSTYKGNVQTSVDGTTERKLPGITDLTDPHVVIESPLANSDANYEQNTELQKFSNKAGIVIRPATYTGGKVTTTKTPTKLVTKSGVTTTTVSSPVTTTTTSSFVQTSAASIWAYVPDGTQSGTYTGPYTRENEDGSLSDYYLVDITSQVPSLDNILKTTTGTSTTQSDDTDNGFYDHREGAWLTIHNIDVAELKAAVADTSNPTLSQYWNGILYVDCAGASTTTTPLSDETGTPVTSGSGRNTTVTQTNYTNITQTATGGQTGVLLRNGSLGNLPLVTGKDSDDQGFTLATNDPLYIKGNFNANGSIDTATPSNNRVADAANESMACLAADAITVLSNAWTNAKSSLGTAQKTASQTEVSAVFMTGLVSTHIGTSYSGGMHNLPRFLEYWGDSRAFGYRGSLLAFYYSQRATGLWKNDWYQPPWRIWGWDKRLEKGRKVYGLGRVITFRRTGFSEISGSAYDTNTSGL